VLHSFPTRRSSDLNEYEGRIKKYNDKTVTVEFEKDGETVTRYRPFYTILRKIVAEAAVAEDA
jgi:hypothetical protein